MTVWQSKEWLEMRARLIKDYCEQCATREGPFVIQHFSHVRPIKPSKEWHPYFLMRQMGKQAKPIEEERLTCPRCKSINIRTRKTTKFRYVCNRCDGVFNNPVLRIAQKAMRGKEWDDAKEKANRDFKRDYKKEIKATFRAALKTYERERKQSYEKYVSGEGTETFCRKCAYMWDVPKMKLCPTCKRNYAYFQYEQCWVCNELTMGT